jgi:hypothetical protein
VTGERGRCVESEAAAAMEAALSWSAMVSTWCQECLAESPQALPYVTQKCVFANVSAQ